MERITRTTILPFDLDSMVVGMSSATQLTTAEIIRECVYIAQMEPIVRRELLRRLEEVKQRKRDVEAYTRTCGFKERIKRLNRVRFLKSVR